LRKELERKVSYEGPREANGKKKHVFQIILNWGTRKE